LPITRLPQTVLHRLNLTGFKQAAPYLKKLQQFYCPPMTYHNLCPLECWRCIGRIESMADQMSAPFTVGAWHNIVADTTARIVEEALERRKSVSQVTSTEDLAARFLQNLEG